MLRQLFSALTSARGINESFDHFEQMLDHARGNFGTAISVLTGESSSADVADALYDRDVQINKLERQIRRELVRHLTVYPGKDVAACLTLMSIAKDAERIGDYCKNVFEVGRFYTEPWTDVRFADPLRQVQLQVEALFDQTIAAFHDSDEHDAKQILKSVGHIKDKCSKIEHELLEESSRLQTSQAVAYSLMTRHFKRVAAHLGNICTAITGNVAQLGYLPNKREPRDNESDA